MIVNTAYPYMGQAAPSTPKLWGEGKVYVPYELIGDATFQPDTGTYGSRFVLPNSTSGVNLTINAKGYSKISLSMNRQGSGGVQITFAYYKGSTLLGTVQQRIDNYVTGYQVAIPSEAQTKGVTLKITQPTSAVVNLWEATMIA